MWYEHRLSVLVAVDAGTTYEVCLGHQKNSWCGAPAVDAGTTYEVCLRHQKKTSPCGMSTGCWCWYHLRGLLRTPKKLVMWSTGCRCWYHLRGLLTTPKKNRHVVWAPAVGAGTTYEVCLRNQKKTSPCGMSTGCRCWYHLRGLLTKPRKISWCGMITVSRFWNHVRGLLTKPKNTSHCDATTGSRRWHHHICTRSAYDLQHKRIRRDVVPAPADCADSKGAKMPLSTLNTVSYGKQICFVFK
jgi:hypothetical protein